MVTYMKILICDDDIEIINEIEGLLSEHGGDFEITKAQNGNKLIESDEKFDLAFVDIEMPQVNGLALTKRLKKNNPNIIVFIVTSFNGYLDDAMDLNVFRYLSKPINRERFFKGLTSAMKLYRQNTESVVIETNEGLQTISSSEILYIAIDNRKTKIVTDKAEFKSVNNLDYWRKILANLSFAQPHYSFIVNLKNVTNFSRTEITLSLGDKTEYVPISRGHYNDFREAFFNYVGVTV